MRLIHFIIQSKIKFCKKECGDELIGDCYSEEDVINMKDHQLKNVLEVLEKSVEEWDTDKCEAVR